MGTTPQPLWRRALAGVVVGVVAIALTAAPAAAGPDPAAAAVASKVEAKVLEAAESADKITFWVRFSAKADLTSAAEKSTKAQRAAAVRQAKLATANSSQAGVRKLLDSAEADYETFWISNTIKVVGSAKLLAELAVRPEVSAIEADQVIPLPAPIVEPKSIPAVNAIEWNLDRIRAPQAWAEFGRGEGIVIANIDSGVQFNHPAVATQYRGRSADGVIDHNYNWFDPSNVCPTAAPCDNNNHGTHTMGTMVGDDGGANQIGVAPGARWIAAKGCETNNCSETALLRSGEWMVAPTDLTGANPRPDLAPDIVNNSWGGAGFDPWYYDIVNSWRAAGIFPAFSNGNAGPSCNTSGSPGTYIASYSSGAFDVNNVIASFSSRGAGENGEIKPNLAAPGVNVRSSIAGSGYGSLSGTSMASPHTAASVALLWSAAPALHGDIEATILLLDNTAIDVNNTSCGGTEADNNVFGEGRLDAYALISSAPRGSLGSLAGTVTRSGAPVAGVQVVADGPISRTAVTGADGGYQFPILSTGNYTVTASKFGYVTYTGSATVSEGETAVHDVVLAAAPSATVTGTVSSAAGPAVGASVKLLGTPVSTTTNASGQYSFTAPVGDYQLSVSSPYRCADPVIQPLALTGDRTLDVTLPQRVDGFGYACEASTVEYPNLSTLVNLTGDDAMTSVNLPFPVPFYGQVHSAASITTNGVIAFGGSSTSRANVGIPSTAVPNGALFPLWDDWVVDASSGIYSGVVGSAPHRWYAVEWRNVRSFFDAAQRLSFVAMINEDGSVVFRYKDVEGASYEAGVGATIGLENMAGTVGFEYSLDAAVLSEGLAVGFQSTKHGVVRGTVTDANDGLAVSGASVGLNQGGSPVGSATSNAAGGWLVQVPVGDIATTVSATAYESKTVPVVLGAGQVAVVDTSLRTAKVQVTPATVEVISPSGQARTRTFNVTNNGSLATAVELTEVGGDVPWLAASLGASSLAPGAATTLTVTVDAAGMDAGTVAEAGLRLTSASGRAPQLTVPVKLIVPGFQSALDSGSKASHVDVLGDTWTADAAHAAGGCGYLGTSSTLSTSKSISGTGDPGRFADARLNMYEYRCDGLADGVYMVELGFAEITNIRANKRVFDVLIEGAVVLPSLDIAGEIGTYTALTKTFTVTVTDGVLNVRFITHTGFGKPIVNSVRVTHRPDLN